MLLGFYVNAAFSRYADAGNVWGDDLRAACHTISVQFLMMTPAGSWHEGDQERILAHIAAIPLTLKMELRDERDIRELKGLLSDEDLGKIVAADSMSSHCVDVVRAYYCSGLCRPSHMEDHVGPLTGIRTAFCKYEVTNLEEAVRQCKFLKTFPIAPAFMVLLRTLLGVWLILLPFVLAESDGTLSSQNFLLPPFFSSCGLC